MLFNTKCWCNGWATSRRYHEDKLLPCLFGCSKCSDDLHHYLQCPHLFALWGFLAGGASADPLARWGLIQPNSNKFNLIACTFSGYHAVRRNFRLRKEFFTFDQEILNGQQIRSAWSVFADSFFVEARELGVQCRRFSLPSFFGYLNQLSCLNIATDSYREFEVQQEPVETGRAGLPSPDYGQASN